MATSRLSPGRARGLPRRWLVAPQQRHAALLDKIKRLHVASDEVYGSPRVLADLREDGEQVFRKTVAKLGTRARGSGRVPLLADTTQKVGRGSGRVTMSGEGNVAQSCDSFDAAGLPRLGHPGP